jgi:ABC-type transport system substrate-binding protein
MRSKKRTSIFYTPSSIPDDGGETVNTWFTSGSFWPAGNINRPEYDAFFAKQLKTPDLEERKKILQDFAKLESENLENIPLLWCGTPFAVSNKRIQDWNPALGSGYHTTIRELRLK